ncbi:hypothetical protein SDC9_165911 [bioreactor metagenome]|uniref:Uncharacterized protein n=1 Tax=bioreactor metagenome TaxID=1076179 RepID=A0A645FVK4_9ZZZZ
MGFGVVAFLQRLADDAAAGMAHGHALHLAPQDGPPHQCGGETGGVAHHHPARRRTADAKLGAVDVGLPG